MSSDNQIHEYDGIIEENNPMPTWWLIIFYATIIFGFIYYIHYELGGGPTLKQELKVAMEEVKKSQAQNPVSLDLKEDEVLALSKNPDQMSVAHNAYMSKCASCHGPEMGGQIGPNLTDKYWIHGKGSAQDIAKVIHDGVLDKGMPPWGSLISADELKLLVAYVISKKDSHPKVAKEPQGQIVE